MDFQNAPAGIAELTSSFPLPKAGIEIACPSCAQTTSLWLPATEDGDFDTIEPEAPLGSADVLGAFAGVCQRSRVSPPYTLALMLITVVMVLLPYLLGLTVLAGYGVYYWAVHARGMLTVTHNARLLLILGVVYVAPLFAGVVLVFFMFKPWFAPRANFPQPLALNPAAEKTLFAFITKICELVGAPLPRRIDLDAELNASASFRRGWRSLFSNDLVLTIGLPLVAGMTTRQLAGIIAHEFGHFTQGTAMRLTYVVDRVNFWFGA